MQKKIITIPETDATIGRLEKLLCGQTSAITRNGKNIKIETGEKNHQIVVRILEEKGLFANATVRSVNPVWEKVFCGGA